MNRTPYTRLTTISGYRNSIKNPTGGPIPECVKQHKQLVIDLFNHLLTIEDYKLLIYNNQRYNGICHLIADAIEGSPHGWPYTEVSNWIMIAGYISGYVNAGRMCPERRQLIIDLLEELNAA